MELRGGVETGVLQPATKEDGNGGVHVATGGKKSYKGGAACEPATIFARTSEPRCYNRHQNTTGDPKCYNL